MITNEQVKDLIVAYFAQAKGPVFSAADEGGKEAGKWIGEMFNELKKTIQAEQAK